jgi:hypothetical protein
MNRSKKIIINLEVWLIHLIIKNNYNMINARIFKILLIRNKMITFEILNL